VSLYGSLFNEFMHANPEDLRNDLIRMDTHYLFGTNSELVGALLINLLGRVSQLQQQVAKLEGKLV
jgi:hypothetical protein